MSQRHQHSEAARTGPLKRTEQLAKNSILQMVLHKLKLVHHNLFHVPPFQQLSGGSVTKF
jgi:hypothetical protein